MLQDERSSQTGKGTESAWAGPQTAADGDPATIAGPLEGLLLGDEPLLGIFAQSRRALAMTPSHDPRLRPRLHSDMWRTARAFDADPWQTEFSGSSRRRCEADKKAGVAFPGGKSFSEDTR